MINAPSVDIGNANGAKLRHIRPIDALSAPVCRESQDYDVLILDDNAAFGRQLTTCLQRHDFIAHHADNRQMARRIFHTTRPKFAILELRLRCDPLAHHTGLELISEFRMLQPNMHIVVVTDYSSIVSAVAAIKAGAADYLLKPASVDAVMKALTHTKQPACLRDNPMSADRLRWEYLLRVFFQCDQNVSATARTLGMHRRTLQRMLNKRPPPE